MPHNLRLYYLRPLSHTSYKAWSLDTQELSLHAECAHKGYATLCYAMQRMW